MQMKNGNEISPAQTQIRHSHMKINTELIQAISFTTNNGKFTYIQSTTGFVAQLSPFCMTVNTLNAQFLLNKKAQREGKHANGVKKRGLIFLSNFKSNSIPY